jgi:GntR family transcriptional regulator
MSPERKKMLLGPISAAAPGALYQQIVDGLKREVSEGRLKPGTVLPSARELAEDLLVSVITVKRAYEELEKAGIINGRQGARALVAEQGPDRSRKAKLTSARDLLKRGLQEAAEAGLTQEQALQLIKLIQEEEL